MSQSILEGLKSAGVKSLSVPLTPKEPVWDGPESNTANGGVTQGLLAKWLVCKERTRLYLVKGLRPVDAFSHKMEYGNMFHLCCEWAAKGKDPTNRKHGLWKEKLQEYAQSLMGRYPLSQEQIEHWHEVCRVQFPHYLEFWQKHKDSRQKVSLLQEQVFCVPYSLPSGRTVYLKGKWDSVDLINNGVWLGESKTKGEIIEQQLQRQLTFDLQTMLYLVALWNTPSQRWYTQRNVGRNAPRIQGVVYNVIRRPLSGGKYTIVRHKPRGKKGGESKAEFYTRLGGLIKEDPSHFFMRWEVGITPADLARFRREFLDPCLEQVCYWWDWLQIDKSDPFKVPERFIEETSWGCHFRMPYGVSSPLLEGGMTELDRCLDGQGETGLQRVGTLFPELG